MTIDTLTQFLEQLEEKCQAAPDNELPYLIDMDPETVAALIACAEALDYTLSALGSISRYTEYAGREVYQIAEQALERGDPALAQLRDVAERAR